MKNLKRRGKNEEATLKSNREREWADIKKGSEMHLSLSEYGSLLVFSFLNKAPDITRPGITCFISVFIAKKPK